MGSGIKPLPNSSVNTPTTTTTTATQDKKEVSTPPPAPKKQDEPDSAGAARAEKGSKQHATDRYNQTYIQGTLAKKQLEDKIGGDTIANKTKAAGSGEGTPPPTNMKEYMYDKVADKISDSVGKLKPDLKREAYPKLSEEQTAIADAAASIKKYEEYVAYAKTATEILKHSPGNKAVKEALEKNLGNLETVAGKLESASKVLGKVTKYADLAKDAIGVAQSAREMVSNIPNDFRNGKAVEKFAKSLGNTMDHAQSWFDRGRDALIAAGKGGGAAVFAYYTGILGIAVDGLNAGVGNVNKYIEKKHKDIAEQTSGIAKREAKPPDPPPPLRTYTDLRIQEHLDKMGTVRNVIDNQFTEARDGVKKGFQKRHQEVHDKFDKQELPKLYLQNRNQMIKQLREDLKFLSTDQNLREGETIASRRALAVNTNDLLKSMESRSGAQLNSHQIQEEITRLQVHYGPPNQKMPVNQLIKSYNGELDKFYAKHGFGEDALEKEYANHGLTRQAKEQLYQQQIRQLGLDTFN